MKNLFTKSAIALVLFSMFAISCNKKGGLPENNNPVPADKGIENTTTWTPKGSNTPIVTKGDIKNGDVGVPYKLEPKLSKDLEGCEGTWNVTVEGPANAQYAAPFSAKKGYVTFTPLTAGTYKIKLTYTCPCGTSIAITITITVS